MLIVIGIVLALSPFSGFPLSWLMWFYLALGLLVAGIGISLRPKPVRRAENVHEASPVLS